MNNLGDRPHAPLPPREQLKSAWRPWRLFLLNVASATALALGSLFAARWFLLVVVLVTFGNLIGIVLLSPTVGNECESERHTKPVP